MYDAYKGMRMSAQEDGNVQETPWASGKVFGLPVINTKIDTERCLYSTKQILTAKDAVELIGEDIVDCSHEVGVALYMDDDMRPISVMILAKGTTCTMRIPIQKILQGALLCNATHFMLIHNHPMPAPDMNNLKPSRKDIQLVSLMMKAAYLAEIKMLDSIIVGINQENGKTERLIYSMKDKKVSKFPKIGVTWKEAFGLDKMGAKTDTEEQLHFDDPLRIDRHEEKDRVKYFIDPNELVSEEPECLCEMSYSEEETKEKLKAMCEQMDRICDHAKELKEQINQRLSLLEETNNER